VAAARSRGRAADGGSPLRRGWVSVAAEPAAGRSAGGTTGRLPGMIRANRGLALGVLVVMGGCAFPSSPQSHTDRATLAACRDYASRVYDERNRADIYSINQVGLPYSDSYLAGHQTIDLAEKFRNE